MTHWTEYTATIFNDKGEIDRKEELIKALTFRSKNIDLDVVKCCFVSATAYVAIKSTNKLTNEFRIYGSVCYTRIRDNVFFGFREDAEEMLPSAIECPKCILDLLTPTQNECANIWRERCYNHKKLHEIKGQLKNSSEGSEIQVKYSYNTMRYVKGLKETFVKKKVSVTSTGKAVYKWVSTTTGNTITENAILEHSPQWRVLLWK